VVGRGAAGVRPFLFFQVRTKETGLSPLGFA
jgi:hypothetical protein